MVHQAPTAAAHTSASLSDPCPGPCSALPPGLWARRPAPWCEVLAHDVGVGQLRFAWGPPVMINADVDSTPDGCSVRSFTVHMLRYSTGGRPRRLRVHTGHVSSRRTLVTADRPYTAGGPWRNLGARTSVSQ